MRAAVQKGSFVEAVVAERDGRGSLLLFLNETVNGSSGFTVTVVLQLCLLNINAVFFHSPFTANKARFSPLRQLCIFFNCESSEMTAFYKSRNWMNRVV